MSRRSVSFHEPPRKWPANYTERESDVDLPGHPVDRFGPDNELSIDTQVMRRPLSHQISFSPVLDPSTYDQLAFCDCAIFPECALGKGIQLDLDVRRHQKQQRKRATADLLLDVPPKVPLAESKQQRKARMTSARMGEDISRWSPPTDPGPTSSPSPPSSRSSPSSLEKAVLFRLPLTITKAKHGQTVAECEVREQRVGGKMEHTEAVNFTEMGLFVAPPSETDPEEAFVVVERRKLVPPPGAENSSELQQQSTVATGLSPVAASSHQQSVQHSPRLSNHHASAECLSIRVSEPPQLPPDIELEDMDRPVGRSPGGRSPKTGQSSQQAGLLLSQQQQQYSPSLMAERREEPAGIVDPQIRLIWAEAVDLSEIRNVEDQTEFRSLRAQLGIDKISAETLSQYHVKGHMDHFDQPAICYPRYRGPSARNRIPNGLKLIRRVNPGDKLNKENYPPDTDRVRFSGMFGLHMITQFDNRIVLCTNERDALAVYDASNGIPALSLPQGERFDAGVIPYLEDFDLIYIWFPHIHERFAKDYASYLNATRCYIITAPLRPVELVRDNRSKEVLHNIQDAVRVRYKGFRSVQDLRDSVRSEILQSKSKLAGLTLWKRYSVLNNYLRGFRPAELTVLSGGSHGKTTFMCEYAMDLYTQGVRTLFCNFEMPEEKILKWMLIQFAGVPLQQRQDHSSVEMWLDRFERTHSDLVVMKTEEFREKTLKEIADAIREQTLACGTQHLVIDNLQALVDMATVHVDAMTAAERTHQQDRFVGMLRRMASSQELHITLVVHPVKEPNAQGYYELHHIGGASAKITQEADNVLVIQRRRDTEDRKKFRKFLYILKNRFGARCLEVDQIEMLFQPSTLIHTLVEVTK